MKVVEAVMTNIYEALLDTGGDLETPVLRLIQSDFNELEVLLTADVEAADFTGAADFALEDPMVAEDAEGKKYIQWDAIEATPSDAVNLPQQIYGYAILDDADVAVAFVKFPAPVALTVADQVMTILPKFRLGDRTTSPIGAIVE